MKTKRKLWLTIGIVIFLAFTISYIAWANKALQINTYKIESHKIAQESIKIAHISDLHNNEIGNANKKLISTLESTSPDIIAITGDLIDSRNTDSDIALDFIKKASEIAPCYYSNGNHEARVQNEYTTLKEKMVTLGVTVLENTAINIELNGNNINIIGVNDPDFYTEQADIIIDKNIKGIKTGGEYTVLLSHRPELFDVYIDNDIDLVLSGHAHGGQFRLPYIGGLFAPHQGILPKYDSGLYSKNNTNMIVSRGIGNSLFPFRFNNKPEIILVELVSKK